MGQILFQPDLLIYLTSEMLENVMKYQSRLGLDIMFFKTSLESHGLLQEKVWCCGL